MHCWVRKNLFCFFFLKGLDYLFWVKLVDYAFFFFFLVLLLVIFVAGLIFLDLYILF